jgi:DNA-binding transcriptional regulator YiaG
MEDDMSDFVRRLRRQLGMTQEEFAHALGITVGTVNRWENKRFRPSKLARSTIVEFARRHGVPTSLPVAEPENGTGATEHDESFH